MDNGLQFASRELYNIQFSAQDIFSPLSTVLWFCRKDGWSMQKNTVEGTEDWTEQLLGNNVIKSNTNIS